MSVYLSRLSWEWNRITAVAQKAARKKSGDFFHGCICKLGSMAPTLIPIQLLFLESCDTRGWGLLISCCVVGSRRLPGWLRSPPPIHLHAAWMWSLLIKWRCSADVVPLGRRGGCSDKKERGGGSRIKVQWCCRVPGAISLSSLTLVLSPARLSVAFFFFLLSVFDCSSC